MKKIALDVGDKTVGIALSDELGITAQGLMTLERVGIRKDTTKVLDLVKEHNCDTIVIGLPKKLDGTDSIQTEKVYEFRTMLENKMRSTGMKDIEVVWQDERLTTVMAEKVLIEADGLAERGTFIINPDGKIVGYEITAGNVGRNAEELFRKVQACQFVHAHGDEVCPANWKPGAETLKPSLDLVGHL